MNRNSFEYNKWLLSQCLYDWEKHGRHFRYLLIDGLPYVDFRHIIDPWDAYNCGLVVSVENLNGYENGACMSNTIGM